MSNLDQLIEQYKSILIAEKYIVHLQKQLDSRKTLLAKLVDIVDNKAYDLDKPEEFNIKSLFNRTLVNAA